MKATVAFIGPPANPANRPVLSPELGAAVAARHSRCDDGLAKILEIVDSCPNQDTAIDRIFNMVDYGHRSVADMVPISVHLEGVSLWLVEMIWGLVHTGGGQETSTRYCELKPDEMYRPPFSHPEDEKDWDFIVGRAVSAYNAAWEFWMAVANVAPEMVGITGDIDPKKAERFKRNFVFDRSRYAIPVTALTNMNITTWGTEWIRIISMLRSAPWEEAHRVAELLAHEVSLAAPRLIRHTGETAAGQQFWDSRLDTVDAHARLHEESPSFVAAGLKHLVNKKDVIGIIDLFDLTESQKQARLTFNCRDISGIDFATEMGLRKNRYDPVGLRLSQVPVEYGWGAVANAEIRDMNRHRPGIREIGLYPQRFYFALDQIQAAMEKAPQLKAQAYSLILDFTDLGQLYRDFAIDTINGDRATDESNFVYFSGLGTELSFNHTSTMGHLIYECELRTGPGTHFRYRRHYNALIEKMIDQTPALGTYMLRGSGEPE